MGMGIALHCLLACLLAPVLAPMDVWVLPGYPLIPGLFLLPCASYTMSLRYTGR